MSTTSLDLVAAHALYNGGLSLPQVAEAVGVGVGALRYRFRSGGYPMRSRTDAVRMAFAEGRIRRAPPKGAKSAKWKGGRRKDSSGYIDLHLPDHPRARSNGYVAEHIVVWEKHHGRPLPDKWHVHHMNGIKDDNRPENLEAMPSKDHMGYIAMQSRRIRELEDEIRRLQALI